MAGGIDDPNLGMQFRANTLAELYRNGPTYNNIYRQDFGGKLPQYDPSIKNDAPIYDLDTVEGRMLLGQTVGAGNQGAILGGAQAFGGAFNPMQLGSTGSNQGDAMIESQRYSPDWENLMGVSAQTGYDTSPYSMDPWAQDDVMLQPGGISYGDLYRRQLAREQGASRGGALDLWDGLNDYTKDYMSIGGLSTGWDGSLTGDRRPNARNNAVTLYKKEGNKLLPVSQPRLGVEERSGSWLDQNQEGVTGLSMMLPMFGGWAGMLGTGTAGTLSAGSGLGLTTGLGSAIGTGAANALTNAAIGSALGGGGTRGFLSSLAGTGINAGLGSLTGGPNNLGALFNTANAGQSALNPMSYFGSTMNNIGLGGSPLGLAFGAAGQLGGSGGFNASRVPSFVGNYVGTKLGGPLGGQLGSQVGQGLNNLWGGT